ncbi:MAG TPA: TonB family protein [Pyrinomonadaceae bacterium]|jgi:TonB family protein
MIRLFLAFFTSLLLLQGTGTQSVKTARQDAANSLPRPAQANRQEAELEESRQLNQKAVQLFKEGKIDEALVLAKRVLQIREKALGKDDQLVIEALINLAEINLSKSFYRASLPLYERVLKNNEKLVGLDDASNIVLLDKIAYLRYMVGDFVGSENSYKRSLSINEKISGRDSEQTAQAAYNLAEFYRFTDSYQKAEPFYRRALDIRDKKLAANDPKLIRTVERYRCIFYLSDRMDKLKDFNAERRALYKSNNPEAPVEVINGKALSLPKPTYPTEAQLTRAKGIVVVKVTVDESGTVVRAESLCGGNGFLVRAATDAAYKARFTPTILSGQHVTFTGLIIYRFAL